MKLLDFLRNKTNVGDVVVFCYAGWQTGCTVIDHEDLFITSLNPELLDQKVHSVRLVSTSWAKNKVLMVELYDNRKSE